MMVIGVTHRTWSNTFAAGLRSVVAPGTYEARRSDTHAHLCLVLEVQTRSTMKQLSRNDIACGYVFVTLLPHLLHV